ncbi:hypothetical protein [Komagataeibacter swingsii]|nr:hypothetical protein [Komagataeibacter swingsii]
MKLFAKASQERRLFSKKAAPKNFYFFYQRVVFKQFLSKEQSPP